MPRDLPVDALSLSSINTLRRCAYKWKLRYVDRQYEPSTPPQLLGKTFGAAEATSDHHWIDTGQPLTTSETLDAYSDEFEFARHGDINWQDKKPERVKDTGATVLKAYHPSVAALPAPVDAEREFRLEVEDVPFVGYIDVEREDGAVEDRKLTGTRISQEKADSDPQATAYLAGRRAEGNPASRFVFDAAVNVKQPYAERVQTDRTDEQLDHFLLDVLGAADEIEWRLQTDTWSFAPPMAWWCGPGPGQCGYWADCPSGGLLRKRAARAVRNG